ncbi:hypothetical protein ACFC0C_05420 [Streptomyces sp. NPDC056178]|uniref:hypothetical protein n=1 Tax=Streptomyces sp. NPDC056178 TaxID=3345735 RepID=UPI0035DBF850
MHVSHFGRRVGKALIVTLIATAVSHLLLSDGLSVSLWSQASENMGEAVAFSDDQAFTMAVLNTMIAMPVVLWAGMRLLRERRVYPMVLVGTLGWFATVGHGIDSIDDRPGALLSLGALVAFAAVTALSSLLLRPRHA